MGHIAKGARPDVTFYECKCFMKHRICEACYIYFERVDRGKNETGSRPELLGKVLVLPRPKQELLIYQFYMMGKEAYAQFHPTDRLRTPKHFSMPATSQTKAFFPTVIPLDKRFFFAVGGCKDKVYQPGREMPNLVLIDPVANNARIAVSKDLTTPVIHPACSIFDRKLLFIAGGMNNGHWISEIQIFDIEKCEMYDIKDKHLKDYGDPLIGPSMSAEFFDTLGLIICGQNQEGETELRIFSSKNNKWTTSKSDCHSIEKFSFVSMKLFPGDKAQMQMLLMGGMDYNNKTSRWGSANIY